MKNQHTGDFKGYKIKQQDLTFKMHLNEQAYSVSEPHLYWI